MTERETDPDAPQPRDIALEQPSPELLQDLEEQSAPEPDDQPGPGTAAQQDATRFGGD